VAEAYVSVVSLPEMTVGGNFALIEGRSLGLNQEAALVLDANNPGGMVTVDVPADTAGVIRASFPGAFATTQLVDADGVLLAESMGGHVDGLTFVLDAGSYGFTLLGSGLSALEGVMNHSRIFPLTLLAAQAVPLPLRGEGLWPPPRLACVGEGD
jgi:hypothetical protein